MSRHARNGCRRQHIDSDGYECGHKAFDWMDKRRSVSPLDFVPCYGVYTSREGGTAMNMLSIGQVARQAGRGGNRALL